MAYVSPFFSKYEGRKPELDRVYHFDDQCPAGKLIPEQDRVPGNGNGALRRCKDCERVEGERRS